MLKWFQQNRCYRQINLKGNGLHENYKNSCEVSDFNIFHIFSSFGLLNRIFSSYGEINALNRYVGSILFINIVLFCVAMIIKQK